jgi:hypothetical protein
LGGFIHNSHRIFITQGYFFQTIIGIIEKMEGSIMFRFEIQSFVRFDWENVSNEALIAQLEYLIGVPGHVEALKQTKREAMRRMSGGEGWSHFEVISEVPRLRAGR